MPKIAIASFSGNVGKTMLTRFLVLPRLPNEVKHVLIETINSDSFDGSDEELTLLQGKDVEAVQEALMLHEDVVVDVGGSNIEDFLKGMALYAGAMEDFDMFIVPVPTGQKEQQDTVTTIDTLVAMGVPKNKIKIVFNRIDLNEEIETACSQLIGYLNSEGIKFSPNVIPKEKFFERASSLGLITEDILADKNDYPALIKAEPDFEKKKELMGKVLLLRQAKDIKNRLDRVAKDIGL